MIARAGFHHSRASQRRVLVRLTRYAARFRTGPPRAWIGEIKIIKLNEHVSDWARHKRYGITPPEAVAERRQQLSLPTNTTVSAGARSELHTSGVVALRQAFPPSTLAPLKKSAATCFEAIGTGRTSEALTEYHFTPFSHSVVLSALLDFGIFSGQELVTPLQVEGFEELVRNAIEGDSVCNLEQCWVRKRYAPGNAPRYYHPNSWHQDGGLGVSFGREPDAPPPLTPMVTCWIPLQSCGGDSPGLEFVRQRPRALLHYTELDDTRLRRRFPAEQFWAPELQFGDGLLFLADTLHRTYTRADMRQDRLSLEYRFFPAEPLSGERKDQTFRLRR